MKSRSFASRVVTGMAVVALLSALALAGTAAVVSRYRWIAEQKLALSETADALAAIILEQAEEDSIPIDEAAPEALNDSAVASYRLELWEGAKLVPSEISRRFPDGTTLGPPPGAGLFYSRSGWFVHERLLGGGVTLLIGAAEEERKRALGVFGWSLAVSLPFCVLIAGLIGWFVARRVTRPLVEFTSRIRDLDCAKLGSPQGVAEGVASGLPPREIVALDLAFGQLMARLTSTLAREIEFAGNASHEIRTPLTAIRLYAETAKAGATAQARHSLDRQIEEIDRMVRLVDSLLILSREDATDPGAGETVNLADLVREAAARPSNGASSHVAPVTLSVPDEALVRVDGSLIAIAVENLIDNARKFAPAGTPVEVVVSESNDRVSLTVSNDGPPLAPDIARHLFERFYRSPEARATRSGHGLGLPIARHIARLQGGDVAFDPTAEGRIRFRLELPAWRAPSHGGPRSG